MAGTQEFIFGPKEEAGVQVRLPMGMNLLGPEGSCEMVINSRGVQDRSSWFEVWNGVRIINAM